MRIVSFPVRFLFLAFLTTLAFGMPLRAQTAGTYEPGFIVTETGDSIRVEILNMDWKNNPVEIRYRLNGKEFRGTLNDIKKFGRPGRWEYVRARVLMDTVPDLLSRLTKSRHPQLVPQTVFLKTLVRGRADLYAYYRPNLVRFFFRLDNDSIQPLIHKHYRVMIGSIEIMAENNDYKQTLYEKLRCPSFDRKRFENLRYEASPLRKLFADYNDCTGASYTVYSIYLSPHIFSVSAGVEPAFMQVKMQTPFEDFPGNGRNGIFMPGASLQFEYRPPYDHNRWGIYTGIIFRQFKIERSGTILNKKLGTEEPYAYRFEHRSLNIPLGIRYYHYTERKHTWYVDAAYALSINMGSQFIYIRHGDTLAELTPGAKDYIRLGGGLRLKNFDLGLAGLYNGNFFKNFFYYRAPGVGIMLHAAVYLGEIKNFSF